MGNTDNCIINIANIVGTLFLAEEGVIDITFECFESDGVTPKMCVTSGVLRAACGDAGVCEIEQNSTTLEWECIDKTNVCYDYQLPTPMPTTDPTLFPTTNPTTTLPTESPTQSQITDVVYIDTTGNNINNCTQSQPCLTMERAINYIRTYHGGYGLIEVGDGSFDVPNFYSKFDHIIVNGNGEQTNIFQSDLGIQCEWKCEFTMRNFKCSAAQVRVRNEGIAVFDNVIVLYLMMVQMFHSLIVPSQIFVIYHLLFLINQWYHLMGVCLNKMMEQTKQ